MFLTRPSPEASAFEVESALPPEVLLVVDEPASAAASPLEASSLDPVVALAVASAPVVMSVVSDEALAPESVTVPVPVAVIPAVTEVSPTAPVLVCVVVALTVNPPEPASAVLLTDGVTVWLIAPVAPLPSQSALQDELESAQVEVAAPVAVLSALGLDVIVVFPVLFELSDDGSTVIWFPETVPVPYACGVEYTVALPPVVLLLVVEVPTAVASPLELSSLLPVAAVALPAPPVVVPLVVLVALAPEPVTLPFPVAVIGAVTLVLPMVALLLWLAPTVIEVGPPAVAELSVDGATDCVMAPVVPRLSQSDITKQLAVELADVVVSAPSALLLAYGLLVIQVLPVSLLLDADGLTVRSLPQASHSFVERVPT
ncbi:MAG: hypothetical protein ABI401_04655 [Candidatus Dormibacter sp.]